MLPAWGSTLALLQVAAVVLAAVALVPALARAAVPLALILCALLLLFLPRDGAAFWLSAVALASLAGVQAASRRRANAVRSMLAGVSFTALAAAASTTV